MRISKDLFYELHVKNAFYTFSKNYSTNAGSSQPAHFIIIGLSLFVAPVRLGVQSDID
jgi:hypothetical protein